jgi:hypothetical protein
MSLVPKCPSNELTGGALRAPPDARTSPTSALVAAPNLVNTRAAGDVAAPGRASEPAAERPLVVHTKSSATFHTVLDQNTGEIQQFRLDAKRREYVQVSNDDAARIDARERRFLLQRESRRP